MEDNQVSKTDLKPQSCGALTLKDDSEGKNQLAVRVLDLFNTCKVYGKTPEAVESIIRVFNQSLGRYPTEKVMLAIDTHAERSTEMPTLADIIGLIKRNGRPPLSESRYIAITKKRADERSDEDWRYIRAYEAEQSASWAGHPDESHNDDRAENIRLRKEIVELKKENQRLAGVIADLKRQPPPPPKPELTAAEKVAKTIRHMRETGASAQAIADFEISAIEIGMTE